MANSIVMKSFYAGLAAFVLCMISATAGGMTWGATVSGWVVFLSVALSVAAGIGAFCWQVELASQQWNIERRDVIDRLEDAQRCIKAEEQAHGRTRQELISVRQKLTQANTDATTAKTEYGNMRDRAAERGRTIKALEDRIASDNNTWRKQVSNLAESAYKMAVHIEGSANGLPDEWQAWGAELAQDLRRLSGSGGVQVEPDDRQTTIEDAIAEPAAPTPLHIAHQLMEKVRANQAVRRDNLDRLCKAIEDGYELGEAITATYKRGALCVTDDMIANEIAAVKAWEVGQRHADKGWHK